MDLMSMVLENKFCTHLLSLHLQNIKYTENQESNFSKKNKSVLSHKTSYLGNDDTTLADFNGEKIPLLVN